MAVGAISYFLLAFFFNSFLTSPGGLPGPATSKSTRILLEIQNSGPYWKPVESESTLNEMPGDSNARSIFPEALLSLNADPTT